MRESIGLHRKHVVGHQTVFDNRQAEALADSQIAEAFQSICQRLGQVELGMVEPHERCLSSAAYYNHCCRGQV